MKMIQTSTALVLGLALTGCASGTKVTSTPTKTETTYSDAIGVPFLGLIPAGSTTTTETTTTVAPVAKAESKKETTTVATTKRPVEPGKLAKDIPLEVEPITFETNLAAITGKNKESVASLAKWLKAHPTAKVTIEGHTDAPGTPAFNKALGAKRAEAVRQSLRQQGVAAKRIAVLNRGGDATERKATATIAID